MSKTKIVLEDVLIEIYDQTILNEVSLLIEEGHFYRISGENGSGKTVLINTLLGFVKVRTGRLEISYSRDRTTYIQDGPFFFDDDRIVSILKSYIKLYRVNKNVIEVAMKRLNFNIEWYSTKRISDLSKGMKKKLLVLPIFFDNIDFLVLDEAFTGLDIYSQIEMIQRLGQIVSQGSTVIVVEHNESIFDEIERVSGKHKWEEIHCTNNEVFVL